MNEICRRTEHYPIMAKAHRTTLVGMLAITALLLPTSLLKAQESITRRTAIVKAIEKTRSSIVNIRTLRTVPARLSGVDNNGRVRGLGTGVIIDPRGYLVTNFHVVEKVDSITAVTSSGSQIRAKVINYDRDGDLAVLKLEGNGPYPFLPMWGADTPMVGETVIAIGNPYGLKNTVSTGIVSATDRRLKLPNGEYFDGLIQTDASINPGNSGGPLLSIHGDLMGINVAIRSNAQGIAFAIPTPSARKMVEELMGKPTLPINSHGLHLREEAITTKAAGGQAQPEVEPNPYVLINHVDRGSSAEKMGFRSGDRVVKVQGQPVRMMFDVNRIMWDRNGGETITFEVKGNDDELRKIRLTLSQPRKLSDDEVLWSYVGIRVRKVSAQRVQTVHQSLKGGLVITEVSPGSVAHRTGFVPGDILFGLHEWEMLEPGNVRYVLQWPGLSQQDGVKYHIVRDNQMKSGTISLPAIKS